MAELLHRLTGIMKSALEVYEDKVIVKKKGALISLLNNKFMGDKSFYISDISAIDHRPATMLANGYIRILTPGNTDSGNGVNDAIYDENAIVFKRDKNEVAQKIVATIERLRHQPTSSAVHSPADELRKYKALADDGVITQAEFEAKKKQILGI